MIRSRCVYLPASDVTYRYAGVRTILCILLGLHCVIFFVYYKVDGTFSNLTSNEHNATTSRSFVSGTVGRFVVVYLHVLTAY